MTPLGEELLRRIGRDGPMTVATFMAAALAHAARANHALLMPKLGEAVEPAHAAPPQPWWRTPGARAAEEPQAVEEVPARLRDLPWPLD